MEEHEPAHLVLAAEYEAQCRMIDFMHGLVRAALMRERTPRQQSFHRFVREALALHRGENLTVGPFPMTTEDSRIANTAFRDKLAELHAQLCASLDELDG